ncbi:hypothetical protein DYB25_006320 [Aphanomyces astaci]|uniref:FYVE-type domain-containing protein n=1 Tax=Aphanomyces astaci TaxID=112090 RepID=A0A397BQ94_APHAT|nr:hypothetical protein DYB25_006320 [Aphanomyces astaci]
MLALRGGIRAGWPLSKMAPTKFPLPANFFRCPMLTPAEKAEYLHTASENAIDLVAHCIMDATGPLQWTLESASTDIKIYTSNDPTLPSHVLCYAGVVEVKASVDEVAALFQTHTTDLYKEFRRRFASDLLDGHNLYTLARPTETHPLKAVNIKWTVNEMPGGGLLSNRDWCFLESMYEFDQNGRRGWVRAVYSTELRCCPDLQASLGVVRGTFFRSGHVFVESDRPGYLRGTLLFQANMNGGFQKGLIPSWVVKAGVRRRIRGISDIHTFLRESRLSQGPLIGAWDFVDKATRQRCYLCSKKFGPLLRKAWCRKCGEVVCHSCSSKWTLSMSDTPVRACSACALGLVAPHTFAMDAVKSAPAAMVAPHLLRRDGSTDAGDKPLRQTISDPTDPHMPRGVPSTHSQPTYRQPLASRIEFYDIGSQHKRANNRKKQQLLQSVGFEEGALYSTQGPIVLEDARFHERDHTARDDFWNS